jgi:NAD(P)-dependent dehydrogenase (short-subunit alcohol dehydrogenase family)
VLVNNAGVRGEPEPIEETSLASWERSIAIMQTGVFLGLKWAAPALLESGRASVVNISSIFGASDDATFVTGSELYIDGGYLAR